MRSILLGFDSFDPVTFEILAEKGELPDAFPGQEVLQGGPEDAEAVDDAPAEVDRGGLLDAGDRSRGPGRGHGKRQHRRRCRRAR